MSHLIGLCALHPRAGKTSAAEFLCAEYDYLRESFAQPIKDMLSAGLSLAPPANKEAPLKKYGGLSYRQLCQTLGTDWGRNMVHQDVWVDVARRAIKWDRENYPDDGIVFDDVRMPNEAAMIREEGGVIVRIERTKGAPTVADSHPIEHGKVEPDWIVRAANLAELRRNMRTLLAVM